MRAHATALADHEKPHRADSGRGGVVHPCFVRGGQWSGVPLHHVADTVAAAFSATDRLADIGIRGWDRFKRGVRAMVGGVEILARFVTLGLGVETVDGYEILSGVGVGGTETTAPMERVVTAWTTSPFSVLASGFGFGGGLDGTECLGCFVFHTTQ